MIYTPNTHKAGKNQQKKDNSIEKKVTRYEQVTNLY